MKRCCSINPFNMLPLGIISTALSALAVASTAQAQNEIFGFRMVANVLTFSRMDPIIQQKTGGVSEHVHLVFGGSRFRGEQP